MVVLRYGPEAKAALYCVQKQMRSGFAKELYVRFVKTNHGYKFARA